MGINKFKLNNIIIAIFAFSIGLTSASGYGMGMGGMENGMGGDSYPAAAGGGSPNNLDNLPDGGGMGGDGMGGGMGGM